MNTENKKEIIISELETMIKKETIEKNFYKVRAYRKVVDQLKNIEYIKSMEDVKNVEGIGSKIKLKLEEILKTGKLKSAEVARKTKNLEVYDIFLNIHGVGIAKAKELVDEYKITTIEQLQQELKKTPDILNEKQKIGLQYYIDTQLKIPRKEIDSHYRKISKIIKDNEIDKDTAIKIVGSYRRGVEQSSDIDVLLTVDKNMTIEKRTRIFKKIIESLKENDYLLADFSVGTKKYMGICRVSKSKPARRIDILMTSKEEYPFALLYFTGDFQINIALRKRATELGYTLNEYGLQGKNKPELETEKEIFNFLGYKYLYPKDRRIENLKEL